MTHPVGVNWIVLLEATNEKGESSFGPHDLGALAGAWGPAPPTTLYSPTRYVIQASVRAVCPVSALSAAIGLWNDALRRCGLPAWELARAEVLTPAELEDDLRNAERDDPDTPGLLPCRAPDPVSLAGEELIERALRDDATGLPGRELFIDRLRRELATGIGPCSVLAVMVVRLDPARPGGDQPARPADDPAVGVVAEAAARLAGSLRPVDIVARVGDATLAILARLSSPAEVDGLARRVAARANMATSPGTGTAAEITTATVSLATTFCGGDADELLLMAERATAPAGAVAALQDGRRPPLSVLTIMTVVTNLDRSDTYRKDTSRE